MQERELVMVSKAAELLGVTPAAIHWHIAHSGAYAQPFGEAGGRKAAFYLVDMVQLRELVTRGSAEEPQAETEAE